MGLTKRKDSYYVEFRIVDNGKTPSSRQAFKGRS